MKTKPAVVVYGASGYTGKLITERLVDAGVELGVDERLHPAGQGGHTRRRHAAGLPGGDDHCGLRAKELSGVSDGAVGVRGPVVGDHQCLCGTVAAATAPGGGGPGRIGPHVHWLRLHARLVPWAQLADPGGFVVRRSVTTGSGMR